MDERTQLLVAECKRQEESCLYTSTSLFEWLKSLRFWKVVFVVTPIVLGAIATWPLLVKNAELTWLTGVCAFLAGVFPAVYKALDFDVSLDVVATHAHQFKTLQDRFRQAATVTSLGDFDAFRQAFAELMDRMDAVRSLSLTPPERFFLAAKAKIDAGHYSFATDDPAAGQT